MTAATPLPPSPSPLSPSTPTAAVIARLWPAGLAPDLELSALVDPARGAAMRDLLRRRLDSLCLLGNNVPARLERAAPHLVNLGRASPFTAELIGRGWGQSALVFVRSKLILHDLRRHFLRLLWVSDARGRKLLFRFYDPRVLRRYLPTCTAEELDQVLGPIDSFLLEDEDPGQLIELRRDGPGLRRIVHPLG